MKAYEVGRLLARHELAPQSGPRRRWPSSPAALSKAHQAYLGYGGLGFLLGDGALDYGRENIEEVFYTAHVWRGLFLAGDVQHVNNPGMNRARGPFTVPGIRLHLEF